MERADHVEQSNEFDRFKAGLRLSSPIPLPVHTHHNSVKYLGSDSLYLDQSARYLSQSHTPINCIPGQRMTSSSHTANPIEEQLLSSTIHTQSAPVLKTKTTLSLDSGNQLSEHGVAGDSSIGTLLGCLMAAMYMGGSLPQICLNHSCEKLGLVKNGPNLPWLIEPGGCALLDLFTLGKHCKYEACKDLFYWGKSDFRAIMTRLGE
ncbi:unnamed protein product [Sphenostylis stenocarpa]|uniref:Uncharacterized protein n=1 Tax=Sphenostylis stenocarpa TaxID=92480 RepID=A0AA86VLX8_9FABA|nr:unnamed protein product [Sphenostylis stenocarpa]